MNRAELTARIAAGGRVRFRDAMDSAMNDPDDGWYGSGKAVIGVGGDFTTSPELHPLFGESVARWAAEVWEDLGRPPEIDIVEFGAGQGSLASALLDALAGEWADLSGSARLTLVERSPAMRVRAAEATAPHAASVRIVASLARDELPEMAIVVSNEFVDALPVHVARARGSGVEELCVVADGEGGFRGAWYACEDPDVLRYVESRCPGGEDGRPETVVEAPIDALAWMNDVTGRVRAGGVLTVDYGRGSWPAAPGGTLRAMRARRPVADPVANLFEADLTSDVDFEALAATAAGNGWTARPVDSQGAWLVRMGALERMAQRGRSPVAERLAMKALVVPGGLGERLQVLELRRG